MTMAVMVECNSCGASVELASTRPGYVSIEVLDGWTSPPVRCPACSVPLTDLPHSETIPQMEERARTLVEKVKPDALMEVGAADVLALIARLRARVVGERNIMDMAPGEFPPADYIAP